MTVLNGLRNLGSLALLLAVSIGVCGTVAAAPTRLGGTFAELLPQQQAVVQRWTREYKAIFSGRQISPAEFYDHLPLSTRTTFQAITHALLNTTLTSEQGKRMGTALELIDVVERVAGQIPGTRGDRQFRAYVYLKPHALNKLYAAREFRRVRDNTVYHVGYPINFRQQGGTPSIQFSLARTGRRADIDVDYRSSFGLLALTNGHLTAANSDIRAGQNEIVHNRRWNGLADWWKDILALFVVDPEADESVEGFAPGAELERRRIARGPVENAVHSWLVDWLIKGKPEELMPLISVKAYPCVAEFGGDAKPDSKLALTRILREMDKVAASFHSPTQLDGIVEAVSYPLPDALAVRHSFSTLFSLQEVHDDVAWAIDCRNRYKLPMAESIPKPPHRLGKTFVASLRLKTNGAPGLFLVQTWQQEAGEWRLVSFDIKRKSLSPPASLLSSSAPVPNAGDELIAEQSAKLIDAWLIRKQRDEAAAFFVAEAVSCDAEPSGEALDHFLGAVAKGAVPNQQNGRLEGVIAAPDVEHHNLRLVAHTHSSAFVLAEALGDLQTAATCMLPPKPAQRALARNGDSTERVFATFFELVQPEGQATPVINLYWKQSPSGWRVTSWHIDVD